MHFTHWTTHVVRDHTQLRADCQRIGRRALQSHTNTRGAADVMPQPHRRAVLRHGQINSAIAIVVGRRSASLIAEYRDATRSHRLRAETTGAIASDSAGSNPGALVNGPARVAGLANGALSFDGVNDCVNVPDSAVLDFGGTFSIGLWFNPSQGITASSGRKDLLKKFLSYWLIFNYPSNDGKLSFVLNSGSPVLKSTTSAWTAGQWHHVVATGDGSTLRLFVNGVLEASMSSTVTPVANGYPLQIGGNTEQGYYFPGAIDDVRLYSAALPADAVQALSSIIAAQVAPRPTMAGVTLAGTDARVSFTTVAGRSYRVEWSDNPVSGVWSAVTTNVSGNGGVVQVTHGNGAGARSRFYRAAVLP